MGVSIAERAGHDLKRFMNGGNLTSSVASPSFEKKPFVEALIRRDGIITEDSTPKHIGDIGECIKAVATAKPGDEFSSACGDLSLAIVSGISEGLINTEQLQRIIENLGSFFLAKGSSNAVLGMYRSRLK